MYEATEFCIKWKRDEVMELIPQENGVHKCWKKTQTQFLEFLAAQLFIHHTIFDPVVFFKSLWNGKQALITVFSDYRSHLDGRQGKERERVLQTRLSGHVHCYCRFAGD